MNWSAALVITDVMYIDIQYYIWTNSWSVAGMVIQAGRAHGGFPFVISFLAWFRSNKTLAEVNRLSDIWGHSVVRVMLARKMKDRTSMVLIFTSLFLFLSTRNSFLGDDESDLIS